MEEEYLQPENMLGLYARGAFPMADEIGDIDWYFPEVRTIIPLDNYNVPRSLRKYLKETDLKFSFDTDTFEIIKKCADREETWISNKLIDAYVGLKSFDAIHSVSVYQNQKLVGGLYGISFRGAFFGESMYSDIPQASKCALVKLIEHLNQNNFKVLDVQYQTDHLKMFGATEVSLEEYENLLFEAYKFFPKFINTP